MKGGPLGEMPVMGRIGPTPRVLKQHLDQFVVGQDRSKKVMSVAVFNHYQRILEIQRREEEEHQLLQQRLRKERAKPYPIEGMLDLGRTMKVKLTMRQMSFQDSRKLYRLSLPQRPLVARPRSKIRN